MHLDSAQAWQYIYGNRLPIISAISLLVGAAVKTAPIPGVKFNLYTWLYDFSHQFLNITNTRMTSQTIPTPPESAKVPLDPKL